MIATVLLALLIALTLIMIMAPLVRTSQITARASLTRELEASRSQLDQIEAEVASDFLDDAGAKRARRAMEKRISRLEEQLASLAEDSSDQPLPKWLNYAVPLLLIAFVAGVYPVIGNPFYDRASATATDPNADLIERLQGMSPEEVESFLLERLAEDPDPVGYLILARVRMNLSKFDEALAAYDRVMEMTDQDPRVVEERQLATQIIAQVRSGTAPHAQAPQLSEDAIAEMNALSEEEQLARIESMMDGLAARLDANPDDLSGWLRLIRARMVMDQRTDAAEALATARIQFAEEPDALNALNGLALEIGLE